MKFREHAILFLATGFFIGRIPFAPGTFGSLVGLPLCFLLSKLGSGLSAVFVALFISGAIGLSSAAEKYLKQKDPAAIVIDEIAGMLVTFMSLPFNLQTAVFGFVLFRVFDILKPFPIRLLERNVGGGVGIVMDDVLAGLYTNLILRLAFYVIGTLASQ